MSGRLRTALHTSTGWSAIALWVPLVVLMVIAPSIWGETAMVLDFASTSAGPSLAHPFGTDALGRDVFARTLAATPLSIGLAVLAVAVGVVLGVPIGAVVGAVGGRLRRWLGRFIHMTLMFPPPLIAVFFITILGVGGVNAAIAIGISVAPSFARVAQTLSASAAASDYVSAARALGAGRWRLVFRHILPNTGEALVLQVASSAGMALVVLAGFSFLGFGVQAPGYDWGKMLADGLSALATNPLPAIVPGVAVVLTALAFNLLGDTLARALAPVHGVHRDRRKAKRPAAPTREAASPSPPATLVESTASRPLVDVRNLRVTFPLGGGSFEAVAGINLTVQHGEILGIVGESGSGKTMLSMALAGLVPHPGVVSADRGEIDGVDLAAVSHRKADQILGTRLGVVFQDPMSSLNPVMTVGRQLAEKPIAHLGASKNDALEIARRGLAEVGIPAPERRLKQYPHEYSGGMRQRVMIAMGLGTKPALIIADEPTTALDVTVQAQILDVLRQINREHGTAIVLVSHDLAVIKQICSRVVVMYAGRVVETLPGADLAERSMHPYTRALLDTVVDIDADRHERLKTIKAGEVPARGCAFASRCPLAVDRCHESDPALTQVGDHHEVACWVAAEEVKHDAARIA